MAIGDTPNQNLFGTNYNSEEEEEKKARLAAQGAMMGAGDQSFRGATGIQDIAGMQGVPQGGTLDPTQGARDLLIGRQFNRGKPIRISDMGSLIQAPQEVPQSAFGQAPAEPAVTTTANENGFFSPGGFGYEYLGGRLGENIGKFAGEQLYGTGITAEGQATGFPVDRPSLAGDLLTLPGTALNLVGDFGTDPLIAGSELAKDAASYATGATGVQAQQEAQAAQAALDLAATQGVTPTAETPSGSAQGQVGAVQSPFLQSPDTPSGLGGPLLRGFDMVNDAARGPNAPMGQDATRTALSGMTLNEYLNAPAGTEGVSGLRTDPQGRMIPAGFETRAEAFPDFERESAAREARLDARPDFNKAVSDRDRRAARGDGISMADQVDMAKANARGASPREVARGNQVANALGVDLKTGQSLQENEDFKPQIVEIGGQKLIQLAPEYYQQIKPEPKPGEQFVPRQLEYNGFTYVEERPNQFSKQPSTKTGGTTGAVSSAIADAIAAGGEEVTTTPVTTSTSSAPVRINSQAEYDALAVGTPYIDSQGTETVKK